MRICAGLLLVGLTILALACSSGESDATVDPTFTLSPTETPNVEATVKAAIASTAEAQRSIEATVSARVEDAMATALTVKPSPTPTLPATQTPLRPPTLVSTPTPVPTLTPTPEPTPTPTREPTPIPTPTPSFVPAVPTYSSYDLASMVERITPSIVRIETESTTGTGIIYETTNRKSALIVTNYHVVEGANRVDVYVDDSGWHEATVLAYTDWEDVALLEICCGDFRQVTFRGAPGLKPLSWPEPGTEVIAVGYALGIPGSPTVTRGIVSAVRLDYDRTWLIQTDAPINPGNSGGPLLLRTGEVVGINTYKYSSDGAGNTAEGVGFAIEQNTIHYLMRVWKEELNLVSEPLSDSAKPQSYHNIIYDYSVDIPADWTIYDSDPSRVNAFSPDTSPFVGIFVPSDTVESAEADIESYLEFTRDSTSHVHFELLQQHSRTLSDGDSVAYVHFLYRISGESCLEHFREFLFATRLESYWLRARTCVDSLDKYEAVIDRFFNSLTLYR